MQLYKEYAPYYTVICLALFVLFRMYSGVWRYVGLNDIKKLLSINLFTCVIYICGSLFVVGRMPISVYIVGAAIQFGLMCVPRVIPRYIIDGIRVKKASTSVKEAVPLMIVGTGENTRIIQDRVNRDASNNLKPSCIIDPTGNYKGSTFNGIPVSSDPYGVYECIERYGIRCVMFADNDIPKSLYDSVVRICTRKNIEIRDFVIGSESRSKNIGTGSLFENLSEPFEVLSENDNEIVIKVKKKSD